MAEEDNRPIRPLLNYLVHSLKAGVCRDVPSTSGMRRRDINEEWSFIGGLNHGACVPALVQAFNDSVRRRIRWVERKYALSDLGLCEDDLPHFLGKGRRFR